MPRPPASTHRIPPMLRPADSRTATSNAPQAETERKKAAPDGNLGFRTTAIGEIGKQIRPTFRRIETCDDRTHPSRRSVRQLYANEFSPKRIPGRTADREYGCRPQKTTVQETYPSTETLKNSTTPITSPSSPATTTEWILLRRIISSAAVMRASGAIVLGERDMISSARILKKFSL